MTYITVSITHFSHSKTTHVHYYCSTVGQAPVYTFNEMKPDEANKLMWKLIKKGGKNEYYPNPYDNTISIRSVVYYGK